MADDKQKLLDVVTTTKLNDEDFFFIGQKNSVKKIRKENVDFPTDDTLTKEGYPADAKAVGSAIEDLQGLALSTGQPIGVNTKLKMIDTTKNYLYLGEENGFEYGYIYTYVNGAWTKTRLYGKGRDGVDGYTVILTNESYIFPGTVETAQEDEVITEVMVYKGDEVITPTSILVGDLPTGLTAFVHGPLITFTSTTDLVKSNGAIPITIVADRKIFTKYFCYAIAFIGTEHIDFDFDGLNDTLGTLSNNIEGIEQNLTDNYYNKSYFDIDNGDFTLGIERKYKDEIESQLGGYSTTGDTKALIRASADELSSTISTTYSTKNAVNDLANRVNRAVKGVRIEYISIRKGITPEDDDPGWSTAAPQWKDTCDIWQRVVTETATDVYYSNITNISGRDGSAITLDAQVVEYAVSASGTEPPDENADWSLSIPNVPVGSFLWTRTTVVYSDGQYTEAYTVSYRGGDGQIEVSISSIEERYAISNSTTEPADNAFQTSPIPVMTSVNPYLWNYEIISYSDGSTDSTSKKIIGHYGRDGTNGVPGLNGYVHTAWANSADGSTGFSTSVSENKLYLGTYTDNSAPDSNNPSDYNWSLIKGDDGVGITSIVNYYLKTNRQTGVTTAVSEGWSDDPSTQVVDANNPYLWNYEVITYSNGVSSASDPCIIGNYSESGTSISIVSSSVEYQKSESGTVRPTTWLNSLPSLSQGEFLWSKTHVVYSDGTETIAYSVSRFGVDGTPGEDAYTVVLSNENHTFVGTTTHALSGGTTSAVSVYKGSTPVTVTHITVGTKPTGLNSEVNGSTVTFTATESLTTPHGTIPITIEIAGGLTFTKYFSYSIAFAGADAPLISVTADTNVILIDKTGTYIPSTNISVVGTASNTTITSIQYSVDNGAYSNTLPTGVSVSGTTVTVAPQTSIFNTLSIKMSDGSISDTTTIMRVREGRGIASVVEYYVVNNDSSQAPVSNAFGTTIPTMTASNPYLWNYERITYSDGSTPIETTPCIIGRYGSDGTSISNVINYYLATNASSNVTRATTGWTTTIQEVNSTHPYLWNYEEVVFSDSTSVSTSPCVIGNYAADGEDGVDAISCILTNESHVFAGSATAALQASTTTDIIAYKGTQELTIDDVTWSAANIPTGMTLSKSNDKKTITISVTTDMTTANGTIPLNISTDGKIIVKHFSYSVSFKGVNAPSISVVPETNAIIIDKDNNYTPNGSFTVTGFAFNTTITSYQYKVDNGNYITTAPTGVTRSGNIVTINPTTSTFNTLSIRMGDSTINDTTTIIRVREGSDGDDGVSVESITEYYVATNSTTAPADNEFSTTIQQISSTNQYLWNYEVITYSDGDTVPSAKRIIGRYGQDGSSVTVSRTEYQAGTSATTAPTGTWLTSIPSVTEGQYLWTKVTYSDNSTAYSVAKQGVSGTSVTISSIEYAYQLSTSGTTVPTGAWSSAPQAPTATQYAWTRTTTTYSDGNVATTYTVGGKTGTSITISSKSVTYQASASGTTTPTGTWSNSVPSVDKGKFLWTKTYVKYSDNNETTSYSVAYRGTDGTSVSISQESVTYQTSSSGTTTPTGTWQNSVPSVAQGQFLWTKTYVKYSDNTETTSYSVSRYGSDGVSITDVTNYYLASALASGVTTSTTGWTTSIQTTDSSKPYLWNYEVVTYSSGNPTTTDPCIIGNYASDGVDAISCVLTNESHIFAGDDSHALASSTTTDILLFRGATPITPQQVTYTNSEQGKLNVSVSNDNKTITFTATTSLTSSSGNIPITIKVDNNTTITKTFSWSVSFRGADASIITLTSPTQVIKVAENNNKTPNSSFEVTGAATNTTITSWTFGVDGAAFSSSPPTGVTVNTTTNTVTINPATVTFKTLSIKAANSTGQTFDIFTIVQVQDGVTGAPGTGIREVIALYKKTTSKTESKPTVNTESQWSTTPPEWSLGYYIHTCSKITYTDDNVSYTTPSCDSSWEAIYGLNVGGSNLLYWSEKLHDSKETNPTYVPYLNMTITDGVANSDPNSVTKNCYFGSWPRAISYADINNQELTYSIFCKTTDSWGSYNANTNCIMLTVRLVDDEGVQKLSKDLFFENGVKTKTTTPNYTPKSYWTQANVTFFVEDGLFDTGSYNGDKSELYFEIITYNYSTHDLSLKLPKLEIGNIATAWTPNTQDLIGYTDNKLLNYSTTADIINSITNSTSGIGGAIQGKITETTTFIDSQGNPINIVDLKSNQTTLAANLAGYETTVSEITTNLTKETNERKATYGTSITDAGTATKVVTCSNFALYPGATISVKFSNENTNATPALKVNNTDTKAIKTFKGSALAVSEYQWEAGSVLDFVYDGTNWIFVDNGMTARVTSAETRITQNADNIELKVSKNGVISSINQSPEAVTINADKVNIAGAAIFNSYYTKTDIDTTVGTLENSIPTNISDLNNDSGYQTSSQVNSSISSATSNMLTAVTTKDQYYLSTSSSSATGGSWQDTVPTWSANKYIWTRVATTKTTAGNNSTTTYSTAVYDSALTSALSTASNASSTASAAQTTANSAASTVVTTKQYYLSTSTSSATGGSWGTSVPTWSSGKYIWVRFEIVKTPISGTATTTYSPSSAGTYDSALTTALSTANAASDAINNLEVGGRNLARHTSSEWRSQVIADGENKLFYLFPLSANERDNYSTDLTSYGFKAGDVIQLSFDIKFSDDFTASGTGTKHSYIQGNKNWLGESWASLSITGGNRETAIGEIINSASKEGHVSTYFNITADMLDGTYTGYLYTTIRFDYYTGTVYVKNVMLEKSDKPSIWSLAPEDITTEEQRIYYRSSSSTTPNGNGLPIAWVTENGNKYNADATTNNGWSRKITSMANGSTKYPYLWTCIQRRTVNGDISYTDILLDDSTTIIDGGHIITGSVTANQLSTEAIKSNGYTAGASGSPYSSAGTFLDLSNGNIYTPNFGVNSGDAYFKGEVIGGNKTSYNSNNSGYYLGSDGRFGLGDANGYIQYDGTDLNIKGNLTLTNGQSVEEYVGDIDIGGRNLLFDTTNMYKWSVCRGSYINNGVATFISMGSGTNLWREIETSYGLPYSTIRNKTVTISGYVKANSGAQCGINLCLGVSDSKLSYFRKNYRNQIVNFTGTGKWERVFVTVDITDSYFTSGSGSDFEEGNIAFRPGAVNTKLDGFQAKFFQLEIGNMVTDWTPAPEDAIKGDGKNMFINTYDTSMMSNDRYSRPMLENQSTFSYFLNDVSIAPHGVKETDRGESSRLILRFGTGLNDTETLNGMIPGETYTFSLDCRYSLYGIGTNLPSSFGAYLRLAVSDDRSGSLATVYNYNIHAYGAENMSDRGQIFTKHIELTYTVPENATKCYLRFYENTPDDSTIKKQTVAGDFIEIRNLMLEKGMNSSGYAPNSYDLERISYGSGNLFVSSDTFEDWSLTSAPVEIVDGITDYQRRNLLGDTGNSTAPTTQNSNASNTFGSIGGYNTSASSISVGTYDESSNYLTATETATGNRGVGWYTKPGVIKYGEVVTFSCRVKANISTSVHMHTAWRNNSSTASYTGWTNGGSTTIEANTWTDYSYTFTYGSLYQEGEFYVALCFTGNSSGLTWQVAHAKLEKGSVATDWTPAPEDSDPTNLPVTEVDKDGVKILHFPEIMSESIAWRGILSGYGDIGTYIPYFKIKDKRITLSFYVKFASASYDSANTCYISYGLCPQDSDTRTRWIDKPQPYPSSDQWQATTDWQRIYFTTYIRDELFSGGTGNINDTDRLVIRFYNHSIEEMWIKKPMLTIGTIVEDWSPQVASVNSIDLLTDSISSVSSLLNETSSEISDKLTNFKDEYDVFKGEYGEFETSIGERVGDAETNITGLKGSVSKLQSDFNEYRGRVEDYLTYNKGLLQLGTKIENSNTHEMILASSLNLTSTRLEFKLYDYENNGEELPDSSYMTAQMLYNKNLQTDNALILGTVSKGRFAFANLGEGLAFGLASDLLGDELLNDPARKGNNAT